MDEALLALIKNEVAKWIKTYYKSVDVVVGLAAEEESEDDDAKRYLVDCAIREVGHWLLLEVWVLDNQVVSINDLGEGLPLDNIEWPWPAEIAR